MLITEEIWEDSPVKNGWVILPNDTRIKPSSIIRLPCEIGSNCIIDSACVIRPGLIKRGCRIGNHSVIGLGCTIGVDCVIGNNCVIGYGCTLNANSVIGDGCVIPNNTTICVVELSYSANYSGVRDGENLFRLDCEIRPLSWFLSRKKGKDNSGWGRVWTLGEIGEEEYRRYLRFFKDEARRLGI